jgi:hypothetical protein
LNTGFFNTVAERANRFFGFLDDVLIVFGFT